MDFLGCDPATGGDIGHFQRRNPNIRFLLLEETKFENRQIRNILYKSTYKESYTNVLKESKI